MTLEDVQKELEIFINAEMTANLASIDFTFDHLRFDSGNEPIREDTWVRFKMLYAERQTLEIGANGHGAQLGILSINVFSEQQEYRAVLNIASQVENLFKRKSISSTGVNRVYTEEVQSFNNLENQTDKNINIAIQIPFSAIIT